MISLQDGGEQEEGLQPRASPSDTLVVPSGYAQRPNSIVAVCSLPGFWRLAAYQFCGSAAMLIPNVYYRPPLASRVWQDNATAYTAWASAVEFLVAMFGAPQFGRWSDSRPRKTSVLILATAQALRIAPFILLRGAESLWASVVVNVITAPFVPRLTGAPVLFAWYADIIPAELRETGFSITYSVSAFSVWFVGTSISSVVKAFDFPQLTYPATAMGFAVVACLLIAASPARAPLEEDRDPMLRPQSVGDMMLSPFRLVARKRSLWLICGMAAFVTMPDVAVQQVAGPIVLVMEGLDGPGNDQAQALLEGWFLNFPNIVLIFVYATVGLCASRFGPARMLAVWTPITCVFFAAPALLSLQVFQVPAMEVLCGLLMITPVSLFPPMQALIVLLVPPHRKAEAMGAVAAFQNLASLLAPLLMGMVTQTLANHGRTDLYWMLFPGSGIIMLAGAWPFSLLLARHLGSRKEADPNQSDW